MMKMIKNLGKMIALVSLILTTACSDDSYTRMYLYEVESGTRITNGQEIKLYCNRTHKYLVRGGSGQKHVSATEGGNIEHKWSHKGDTLLLRSNFPINSSITLSDNTSNTVSFPIKTEYLNRRYIVKSVEEKVEGGNLTINEVENLKKQMAAQSTIKKGFTFIFIYDNETDEKSGQLRITDQASHITGNKKTFTEGKDISINGDKKTSYQRILVKEDGRSKEYILIKEIDHEGRKHVIQILEDVTRIYEEQHPNLMKGYMIYNVSLN